MAWLDRAINTGEKERESVLELNLGADSVTLSDSDNIGSLGGLTAVVEPSPSKKIKSKTTFVTSLIDTGASWEHHYQSQKKDRAQSMDKLKEGKDKKKDKHRGSLGSRDDGSPIKGSISHSTSEGISDNVNALLLAPSHVVIAGE